MNDTMLTIVGNVVDEPRQRTTANGHPVVNFRVASTPRRFDRAKGTFVDSSTLFVNVTAWRQFGLNVARSVHKGQPIVVIGRYTMREYVVDEQPRSSYDLEAVAVGHDLSRGVSEFTKVRPAPRGVVEMGPDGLPRDDSDVYNDIAPEDLHDEDSMQDSMQGAMQGAMQDTVLDAVPDADVDEREPALAGR